MTITSILVTEHTIFTGVFDQIESALGEARSRSEVRTMARIVAGMLERHGNAERDLAYAALDHALAERQSLEQMHQEHEEIDQNLRNALRSESLPEARRNLAAALATCRSHFAFEEALVFPLMERVLQRDTLTALGKEWARKPDRMLEDDAKAA